MTQNKPRLWVVGLGVMIALLASVAGCVSYAWVRRPTGLFADMFDYNLMQSQPLIGPIIEADPALRSLFLHQTSIAFAQGGWPAATRAFQVLVNSEIMPYAGDRETLACAAAWRTVSHSLQSSPNACRAFLDRNFDVPEVKTQMATAAAACDAATQDGGRRRLTNAKPDLLSDAEYGMIYNRTLTTPTPLTAMEEAALRDRSSEDAAYCQAAVKRDDNQASLPAQLEARYVRTQFHFTMWQPTDGPRPVPPPADALAELHCAAAGTLFTLSMNGNDGIPITWQSLGRQGWDCRLQSSATGERSLWGSDRTNPHRLLGTLSIGKTTTTSDVLLNGSERVTIWRVTGFDRFWLPWAWIRAFTIDEDVTEGDTRHYVVTHYWSPELGFKIGQRAQAITGTLPQTTAPDWQLIAMDDASILSQGRGAAITHTAAAAEIRFALARAEAIHPNLYWYAKRGDVLAREAALVAALPEPARAMDVYLALSEIIGLLGDGHVSLSRPPGPHGDVLASDGASMLTVAITPIKTGLKVVRSGTDGIGAGDVLSSINGRNAVDLFARAASLEPGESELKRYITQFEFPNRLWDFGIRAPFELEGIFGRLPGRIKLAGRAQRPEHNAQDDQGLRVTALPDHIFLVSFDHMRAAPSQFRERLASVFTEIAVGKAQGLIVDLRNNGGGSTELGDNMLDYISNKPRRSFAQMTLRASPECRAYFASKFGRSSSTEDIKGLVDGTTRTWQVPVQTPPPNHLRFTGPVAVLIGPGTFSAANIFANSIADFGLATLIGHDTAEMPNNFGMPCPILLPTTGMVLRVPSTYMVRANGDEASRDDVHPDIMVTQTEDDEPGTDVDVAAARRWLRSRIGNAN